MRSFFFFLFSFSLFVSCSTPIRDRVENKDFSELSQRFLKDYWATHPMAASQVGLAQYDSILEIPDEVSRDRLLSFYKKYLEFFAALPDDELSFSQRTDKKLIMNELEASLWGIESFKAYEWNPSIYNLGRAVSAVLEKESRPLEDRLKDLNEKLTKTPEYYQAAKNNIVKPTKEHLQLAIQQNDGLQDYLNKDVKKQVRKSKLSSEEKKILNQKLIATSLAAKRYITFLAGILANPDSVGGLRSFRIGSDLYRKKFGYELQIESTPEELYRAALVAKEEMRSKMFEAAIELYPKFYGEKLPPKDRQKVIENVVQKVVKNHSKPTDFIESVRKQLPELTKFINEKNILELDPTKPLEVRETPLYERGIAVASIDSPGPYDTSRETYYNVIPINHLSSKQKESYLREYNDLTLQILNIHEAIPGHYTQLVYSNKSPSLIKSIFGNNPMVEGWAVYTERMMLEQGYGNNDPELWLMYYKWFLRVVTNTIIDYEIHNKDLSKADAMKLMTVDAFQEKAEAEAKWNRATVTQVQLASYFAGFTEIFALRELMKEKKGPEFNLKNFHETFLSFGSAPVKEIKKLML